MIKKILMISFKTLLRICYLPFRFLTTGDKVTFLSRQTNTPSLDFVMLSDEIKRTNPSIKTVMLCKRIEKGLFDKFSYFLHMFKQMAHIATSKAVVLDGYCITACLLKHKKSLKIYQIWHALGLLKNFGYTALGTVEGTTQTTAKIMCMHKGYHRIICSSPHISSDISRCYNETADKVLPVGLPRIDFLSSETLLQKMRTKILNIYPELDNNKPVILYVPTLRKNKPVSADELINSVDYNTYNLVVKKHDGEETVVTDKGEFLRNSHLSGLEWISEASYVITDYSAIMFEALVAKRPVYLYCYDLENYDVSRGFAFDYNDIPLPKHKNINSLINELGNFNFENTELQTFIDYHLSARNLNSTAALAKVISEEMKGNDFDYNNVINDISLQRKEFLVK